jgi:hypothetical protein
VVPLVPLNPGGEQDSAAMLALQREVRQLRHEVKVLRLWCLGLEQQQAQLAAAVSLTAPTAGRGLTRFPVGTVVGLAERGTPFGSVGEQPPWPSG